MNLPGQAGNRYRGSPVLNRQAAIGWYHAQIEFTNTSVPATAITLGAKDKLSGFFAGGLRRERLA